MKVDCCTVELLHLMIMMRMRMLLDKNYNWLQLGDDGFSFDDGIGYGID